MRYAAMRSGSRGEAMRWVGRRVLLVHHALRLVIGLLPEQLERCVAEVGAVRTRLGTDSALVALRTHAAQLHVLPAPLGFHPHRRRRRFAIGASNTRWGLTRRLRPRSVCRLPGRAPRSDENHAHEPHR